MHARSAHLLQRHLLADHHLRHARRAEVHRGIAVAHDHEVAESRDVGAAGGARPEQHADLGHDPRELDLVVEDPTGTATAGEHLHLLGDARAGRVHQVDHRHLERHRPFLDAQDLLNGLRPPGARLHGRVVRHQRHGAPVDRAEAGDDAVRAETVLLPVGQQGFLREGALIEQQGDALAHRQLALLDRLVAMSLGTPRQRAGGRLVERLVALARLRVAGGHRSWPRCGR